ncbi:MAG: hypothetical protein KW793_00285 [Candidatus Doudnabacteria bacterium]|nr:hypothetical protein [Candidatus Doudnabacteria bacterium]
MWYILTEQNISKATNAIEDSELRSTVHFCHKLLLSNLLFQHFVAISGVIFALAIALYTTPVQNTTTAGLALIWFYGYWTILEHFVLRPVGIRFGRKVHRTLMLFMRDSPEVFEEAMLFISHYDSVLGKRAKKYCPQL